MKRGLLFLSILAMISIISAQCNETQIDINSASMEELDNLTGIGPVIAQNIINARPFNSVDDLINVSRIGNKTLEKIKSQGLACVTMDENISDNSISIAPDLDSDNSTTANDIIPNTSYQNPPDSKQSPPEVIILNLSSKDIKSSNNVWSSERIALYGFIAFTVLLGFLFAAKKIRMHKTEFQE